MKIKSEQAYFFLIFTQQRAAGINRTVPAGFSYSRYRKSALASWENTERSDCSNFIFIIYMYPQKLLSILGLTPHFCQIIPHNIFYGCYHLTFPNRKLNGWWPQSDSCVEIYFSHVFFLFTISNWNLLFCGYYDDHLVKQ